MTMKPIGPVCAIRNRLKNPDIVSQVILSLRLREITAKTGRILLRVDDDSTRRAMP